MEDTEEAVSDALDDILEKIDFVKYKLYNKYGDLLLKEDLYIPFYKESCNTCGSKLICNGCSNCGKCK